MTAKERLLHEVETLSESEAAAVLEFLEEQKNPRREAPWPPNFAGIGRSGRPDLGACSEEILRADFGRS